MQRISSDNCLFRHYFSRILWIGAFVFLGRSADAEETKIQVHYNDRPPYLVFQDGKLYGSVGAVVAKAFSGAQIPHVFNLTPAARQLLILEQNNGLDCGLNWFKTPSREKIGQFTLPIYRDKPQVMLTWAGHPFLKDGFSVETVFGKRDLTLLVKLKYSYGPRIDQLIETLDPNRIAMTAENLEMIDLIAKKRADFMLIAPDEAEGAVLSAGILKSKIELVKFSNPPPGELRYILCSKKVPKEVIQELNKTIKSLVPNP